MNKRVPAIISTISNSFCDFTLDKAVNEYNMYLILLGTAIGSFIIQYAYGLLTDVVITPNSVIYIILYGICVLFGYILYVESLKRLPVSLAALIESGSLFAYFLIDSICGFIKINFWFCFLFIVFLFSIFLFTYDSYNIKATKKRKKIKLIGIIILLCSMFFYSLEPYLIKIASIAGANEVGINLGYYLFAIPWFLYMYQKHSEGTKKIKKKKFKAIKYILLISFFEAIYYLFGTMGYINEVAVINAIIQEIRVFLLFFLSVFFGDEKLTTKKLIAISLGIISVIGINLY